MLFALDFDCLQTTSRPSGWGGAEAVERNKAVLDFVPADLQTEVRDTWHAEQFLGCSWSLLVTFLHQTLGPEPSIFGPDRWVGPQRPGPQGPGPQGPGGAHKGPANKAWPRARPTRAQAVP